MPESAPLLRIVLTTAANPEEAEGLARAFVEERLAACVTLIPSVRSIYRWEGKVEDAVETLLLIKTGADELAALEERLHTLHSYETPEFLVLETAGASAGYLEWMISTLGKAPGQV